MNDLVEKRKDRAEALSGDRSIKVSTGDHRQGASVVPVVSVCRLPVRLIGRRSIAGGVELKIEN
jgi:hypothetical protein